MYECIYVHMYMYHIEIYIHTPGYICADSPDPPPHPTAAAADGGERAARDQARRERARGAPIG